MKKMYVFDIDRTIKPTFGPIPASTRKALKVLSQNHLVVLATGRSFHEAQAVAQALDITWLVTNGGAQVYEHEYCRYAKAISLEHEIKTLAASGSFYLLTAQDGSYSDHFWSGLSVISYFRFLFSKQSSGHYFFEMFRKVKPLSQITQSPEKIYVISPPSSLQLPYQRLIGPLYSWEYENKAEGIHWLKEYLGNIDEVIAFGDSRNDIEMFRIADRKYAMKHGHPALKALADEVIGLYGGIAQIVKKEQKIDNH